MNKKGLEIATSTIIAIVLGLIVLAIMIVVVQQNVTKSSSGIQDVGKQALETAPDKCQSLIKGQYCFDACGTGYEEVRSPSGRWPDCLDKKCCRKSA